MCTLTQGTVSFHTKDKKKHSCHADTSSTKLHGHPGSLVTGHPGGIPGMLQRSKVLLGRWKWTRVDRLNLRYIVVAEVAIWHIRSRLVEAGYIGSVENGVLLSQDSKCQRRDEAERLAPLVSHQAHRALPDHVIQRGQIVILPLLQVHKVVLQVGLQLPPLLTHVGEIYEEAGAHVPLQQFHLRVGRRAETSHQQVAVLEETTTPDLLGAPGADEPLPQVIECGGEISVDALADDRRMEGGGHGVFGALVE